MSLIAISNNVIIIFYYLIKQKNFFIICYGKLLLNIVLKVLH